MWYQINTNIGNADAYIVFKKISSLIIEALYIIEIYGSKCKKNIQKKFNHKGHCCEGKTDFF